MIIGFNDTNNFEIYVMDLMEELKDKIKSAEDVEQFSTELHESIEIAIMDTLESGTYNSIDPDEYDAQF